MPNLYICSCANEWLIMPLIHKLYFFTVQVRLRALAINGTLLLAVYLFAKWICRLFSWICDCFWTVFAVYL